MKKITLIMITLMTLLAISCKKEDSKGITSQSLVGTCLIPEYKTKGTSFRQVVYEFLPDNKVRAYTFNLGRSITNYSIVNKNTIQIDTYKYTIYEDSTVAVYSDSIHPYLFINSAHFFKIPETNQFLGKTFSGNLYDENNELVTNKFKIEFSSVSNSYTLKNGITTIGTYQYEPICNLAIINGDIYNSDYYSMYINENLYYSHIFGPNISSGTFSPQ